MRVFRLTRAAHADLAGEGARRHGGRWTSPGRAAIYTAAHRSLAVLEVLVNLDLPRELLPSDYVMLEIDVPNGLAAEAAVVDGPFAETFDLRAIGDGWLRVRQAALLSVPSVVVPAERNILINPAHSDSRAIAIVGQAPFAFDPRLL